MSEIAKEEKVIPITSPDQKVLIVGCKNQEALKLIEALAKDLDLELVVLEDKSVDDYIARKQADKEEPKSLDKFLSDEANRKDAEGKAIQMFTFISPIKNIEGAEHQTFTRANITQQTNLSHKQAEEVLGLFEMFGLIEYVQGHHVFKFVFDKGRQHEVIRDEVMMGCELLNTDITRYKYSIDSDEKLDPEAKTELYLNLHKDINDTIEY